MDRSEPTEVSAMSGKRVVAVASGDGHTIALAQGGRVFAWGTQGRHQAGGGDSDPNPNPNPDP